ncbi:toll/interleukin-1 receptor domain-containing protein [Kitasatospora sp. NPDC092039]|uniref:toll/interleukin-1 receptor domain-containing protein n=1 Tax=Kitasatospora sp. NPDC092039 TaxID=3364086 RepID=UPI00381BD3EB
MTRQQRDLFISYSHANTRFVERLAADLREHHVDVWLDTIELQVGAQFHLSIEEAIEDSRYFCLVLSPAALRSYYVRRVEFESAFAKMIRDRLEVFILPILIRKLTQPLPARLAGLQYLNFINAKNYTHNVRALAKRVRLDADTFTGERWYKALEISPFGEIVGVGQISQVAPTGPSVRIIWAQGIVERCEIFYNGDLAHYKAFTFDASGRVHENMMYEREPDGTWRYIDTWRYYYDSASGRRVRKVIDKPGALSRRELTYDGHNRVVEERIVTLSGPPDLSYGYTRKVLEYDSDGLVRRERLYDVLGEEIP